LLDFGAINTQKVHLWRGLPRPLVGLKLLLRDEKQRIGKGMARSKKGRQETAPASVPAPLLARELARQNKRFTIEKILKFLPPDVRF